MGHHYWYWFHISEYFWIAFLGYWMYSARKLKAVKKREPGYERILYMIPLVLAYICTFVDVLTFTVLGRSLFTVDSRIGAAGVAVTAFGIALAIWARAHLGTNWSSAVTVKTGHELIYSGPYRMVRHPIYTGMLTGLLGSAIALGEVRGFLAVFLAILSFYLKARKEERYMTAEFGEQYQAYKTHTGMLLPKLL